MSKKAIVIGGTGATGRQLIRQLLKSDKWEQITSIGRKPVLDGKKNDKLKDIVLESLFDLSSTEELWKGHDVFKVHFKESQKHKRENIPGHVKEEVWRRDRGRCVNCGVRENLEYDHILPVSKGGSSTVRNVQMLCEKCNRSKGAKIGG